jgi:hypothetical protein
MCGEAFHSMRMILSAGCVKPLRYFLVPNEQLTASVYTPFRTLGQLDGTYCIIRPQMGQGT